MVQYHSQTTSTRQSDRKEPTQNDEEMSDQLSIDPLFSQHSTTPNVEAFEAGVIQSTMHRIHPKPLSPDMYDHLQRVLERTRERHDRLMAAAEVFRGRTRRLLGIPREPDTSAMSGESSSSKVRNAQNDETSDCTELSRTHLQTPGTDTECPGSVRPHDIDVEPPRKQPALIQRKTGSKMSWGQFARARMFETLQAATREVEVDGSIKQQRDLQTIAVLGHEERVRSQQEQEVEGCNQKLLEIQREITEVSARLEEISEVVDGLWSFERQYAACHFLKTTVEPVAYVRPAHITPEIETILSEQIRQARAEYYDDYRMKVDRVLNANTRSKLCAVSGGSEV